jgi:DNA-binding transcriptional MerR regulator
MLAFVSKEVAKLFGITLRQLDYWVSTSLVTPSIIASKGKGTTRVYDFQDLVQIRTIKALIEGGMSIQKIRKSVTKLKEWGEEIPLTARLITDGDTIFKIVKDEDELIQAVDTLREGQGVFFISIGKLRKEVEDKVTQFELDKQAA